MIKTPIMIVGAGPTGLMLSAQLHRYGTRHMIVDQKSGITDLSKALGVQARTMEHYRQLGLVDKVLEQGFVGKNVRFIVNGAIKAAIPLGEIGAGLSPYPYLFILEQSRNEALLYDYVTSEGGEVDWATEVVNLQRTDQGYSGLLKRSDGSSEPFECRYLIGCGGSNGPVRQFLEMPFRGSTNEQLFFVADIIMDIGLEKHGLLLVINGDEFLAFFPMAGPNQYRAVGVLPSSISDPNDVPFDLLKSHIEANTGFSATITDHSWHAGYRVHHRIADSFRSENAFLVGDEAHIHSPAGGQGMNTGLGDAVNLGWKLAAVVHGWAAPEILHSYNEERRPFGVSLVQTTDRAFAVMVSKNWLPCFLRTRTLPLVLSLVLRFQVFRRLMFKTISQTRINYRKSSLSSGSKAGSVRSGDRFPWFEWEGGNSFDWLSAIGSVVLHMGGAAPAKPRHWSGPTVEIEVGGKALEAAVQAGLPRSGSVVIRPDMHVEQIISSTL